MRNSTYMNTYKRIVFLFSIVFVLARPVSIVADDYLQWSKSVNCTLNTTSTGANIAGNVTNFPILLRLNAGNFNFAEVQTNGADIRFAKSDGTHLNYQIERCDVSAGIADIWVKVDTVRGNNSSQSIKMFWGKIAAPDSSRPSSVFDTAQGWRGVWHLNGTANLIDQTARQLVDTNHSTTIDAGNIGSSISMGQVNWIGVPPSLMGGMDSNITVSFWNNGNMNGLPKSDDRIDIITSRGAQWYYGFSWRIMKDTSINCFWGDGNGYNDFNYKLTTPSQWKGQWNHWAFRRSPGTWWLYINGAQVATGTTNRAMNGNAVNRVELGSHDCNGDYSYRGKLDEMRFSRANRSSDWVKLEYENQKLNQTVVRLGSPSSLAVDNYTTWSYSQNCTLNTTGSGANVANNVRNFPILIRLNGGNFNFNQLSDQVSGKDLRFAKSDGTHLSYQIERCNPGTPDSAEIWVKLDTVRGNNSSQYIKMYWGKSGAGDSSRPKMVFDTANAYKGVWHFNASTDTIDVSYNQLKARPSSATPQQRPVFSRGIVGPRAVEIAAWNYVAFPSNALAGADSQVTVSFWACGDSITMDKKSGGRHGRTEILESAPYPNGLDMSLTTSDTMVSWRTGGADGSDYCTTPMVTDSLDYKMRWNLWTMTKHSASGRMRVYENGLLRYAATGKTKKINTTIDSLCLGDWGWDYSFRGRIDEFRIAKTERDSNWIKLEYENQKSNQSLVKGPGEDYTQWIYSKNCTLNTTVNGANVINNVTNFPVLLRLNAANFNFSQAKLTGADIRFAKSDGTHLNYQIERYDGGLPDSAEIWVKLDTVRGNNSTQFFKMYWGNAVAMDSSKGGKVFDTTNSYSGVWHLDKNKNFADATVRGNGGMAINGNGLVDQSGIVGRATYFSNNTSLMIGAGAVAGIHNKVTASMWLYGDATLPGEQAVFCADSSGVRKLYADVAWSDQNVHWAAGNNNNPNAYDLIAKQVTTSGYPEVRGQWNHWVFTNDTISREMKIYLNGSLWHSGYSTNRYSMANATVLYVGSYGAGRYPYQGMIDEFRLAGTVRSADWVKLEYENQKLNQTLLKDIYTPLKYRWVGTASASWSTASNWYPNGIPGSLDTVLFSNSVNCNLDVSTQIAKLQMVGYTGTFNKGNFNLVVNGPFLGAAGTLVCGADSLIINGNADFSGLTAFTSTGYTVIKAYKDLTTANEFDTLKYPPEASSFNHLVLWTAPSNTTPNCKRFIIPGAGILKVAGNLIFQNTRQNGNVGSDGFIKFDVFNPAVQVAGSIATNFVGSGVNDNLLDINMGSGIWTAANNVAITPRQLTGSAATLVLNNSSSIQTLKVSGTVSGTIGTINHTGTGTVQLVSPLTVSGSFSQSAGILDFNGYDFTSNGTFSIVNGTSSSIANLGGMTITVGGTTTFSGINATDKLNLNPPSAWTITSVGAIVATSCRIKNSIATNNNGNAFDVNNSNEGGNSGWSFEENYTPWQYSKKFILNTAASGANVATTVVNFPVLIKLNAQNFDFSQAQSNGQDLRFETATGVHLSYEIERFDAPSKQAEIWVKVDQILGNNATQFITMRWGNSTCVSRSLSQNVFAATNNYAAVYHFGTGRELLDATANQNNGTDLGTTSAEGLIGSARYLNGSSYIRIADNATLEPATLTLSCWFKRNGEQTNWSKLVDKGNTAPPFPSYTLEMRDATDKVGFQVAATNNSFYSQNTANEIGDNSWYQLTATFNNATGTGQLFLNGVLKGSFASPNPIEYYTTAAWDLFIGAQSGASAFFKGYIDEVVLANAARSADWVKLAYENQKTAQTLVQSETNNPFANWLYSKKYYLNTTITGANIAADVANFPLAIRLDAATFSFMQAKVDGSDLRFADANNNELSYQIEEWNDAAGQALVWVKVPLVKGNSTENTLTMYWGNFEAAARTSATSVFETANNFAAVYHFGSVNTFNDATANNNNGANFGSSTTTGVLGSCRSFNGQSNVRVADNATLEPANLTISCWFKRSGEQTNWSKIVDKGNPDFPFPSYTLEMRDATDKAGYQTAHTDNNFNSVNTNNEIVDNSWYLLTGTYNSTTGKGELFLNGRSCGTFTNANPVEYYNTAAWDLYIGSQSGNDAGFKGLIDEVVIANTVRSPEWIKLAYVTQKPNQSVVSENPGVQNIVFGLTTPGRILPYGFSGTSWVEDKCPASSDPIFMAGIPYTTGIGGQPATPVNTYSWVLYNLKESLQQLGISGIPSTITGNGGQQDGSSPLEITIRVSGDNAQPSLSDWENAQGSVSEQWHFTSTEPSNKPINIDVSSAHWVWIGVKASQSTTTAYGVLGNLTLKANIVSEDLAQWAHYRKLLVSPATSLDEPVYNMPVAVKLTASNFDFTQANPNGSDLRFTDAAGNQLPYEIEHWTPNPGGDIWVRVSKIASATTGSSDYIVMYWGNPDAVAISSPEATFPTTDGYIAVWHMIEDPKVEPIKDATAYHNDAQASDPALVSRVAGKIRDGVNLQTGFLNAGYLDIGDVSNPAKALTLEAWFKAESFDLKNRIITKMPDVSPGGQELWSLYTKDVAGVIKLAFSIKLNGVLVEAVSDVATAPTITTGEWVYAVATYDGSNIKLFINGALAGTVAATGDVPTNISYPVYIGSKRFESSYFKGVLDEIRISSASRDANWVATAYKAANDLIMQGVFKVASQVAYFDNEYVLEDNIGSDGTKTTNAYEPFADGRTIVTGSGTSLVITPSFYITDHLGSTRLVITKLPSSNAAQVVDAMAYSSYGTVHPLVTPSEKTREKFTGKEFDEDGINLYYVDARYLDPEIGLFTSVDPKSEFINSYRYTTNPIGFVDPTGMQEDAAMLDYHNYRMSSSYDYQTYQYNDNNTSLPMDFMLSPSLRDNTITQGSYYSNEYTSFWYGNNIMYQGDAGNQMALSLGQQPIERNGSISDASFETAMTFYSLGGVGSLANSGLKGLKGAASLLNEVKAAKSAENILVLGRGPLSRLENLAAKEGGKVSTIASNDARTIFKQNYRDIRSADKIIQYMDNIPTTLDEALKIGGQYSRAEVFMINQRRDLLAKTIRKFEFEP